MTQNLVASHLTPEQWVAVDEAIVQLNRALQPLLVAVSPGTKKTMIKMGDGSEAFCRQALDVMERNTALIPRGFDLDEMRRDLQSHDSLNARLVQLTRLLEQIRDAEMALGSDVMASALEGYAVLKAVGKGEGVEALKRMLSKRFDTTPRKPEEPAGGTSGAA